MRRSRVPDDPVSGRCAGYQEGHWHRGMKTQEMPFNREKLKNTRFEGA
jgi:hypothetical protein